MEKMLFTLIQEFNNYSKLVALNYEQVKKGKIDRDTLQWNRGGLDKIEDHLKMVADTMGATLQFEIKEHTFGYDDWKRVLEYRTVWVDFSATEKGGN